MSLALAALLAFTTGAGARASPPPAGVAPAAASRLAKVAIEVPGAAGVVGQLWLRAAPLPPRPPATAADLALPAATPGIFAGVARFAAPWSDARGQSVAPGVYVLRYAIQPPLKEHVGSSPYRDFLLLVPLAADSGAADTVEERHSIAASRTGTGGHPALIALAPVDAAGGVETSIGGRPVRLILDRRVVGEGLF